MRSCSACALQTLMPLIRKAKATRAPVRDVQYPARFETPISVPVLARQRPRADERRMRSDSVPDLPATASEARIGVAAGLSSRPARSFTTSRGLVRFSRLSPDPSTIVGYAPKTAAVSAATAVPAFV